MKFKKDLNKEVLLDDCSEELIKDAEQFREDYPKLYEVFIGMVDTVASHEYVLGDHEWKLETLKTLTKKLLDDDGADFDSPLSTLRPEDIN